MKLEHWIECKVRNSHVFDSNGICSNCKQAKAQSSEIVANQSDTSRKKKHTRKGVQRKRKRRKARNRSIY